MKALNFLPLIFLVNTLFSCSSDSEEEIKPIEEPKSFVIGQDNFEIGETESANPTLWLDLLSLDGESKSFIIADSKPEGDTWMYVNQYCSVLSVYWLQSDLKEGLRFKSLAFEKKKEATNKLISFESLNHQAKYAEEALKGKLVTKENFYQLIEAGENGALAWFGNDTHVLGIRIVGSEYYFYDSNGGKVTVFTELSELKKQIEKFSPNVFVFAE
ncbi:hypothetical protein FUAX_44690 (plasmid) [Fulvitalea axinellae]|uniref:Lipoprotein n=1 Tax=Fulvitalea axinellae TaxID=1182444 RepID=A0AAU9D370_9BACT|nr:hypothetical protein FUAX_44690 [Fulvitalea axinellae]